MFKRINVKALNYGRDLDIYGLFNDRANPVLLMIDVQPKELGTPTKAYGAVEEVRIPP